MTKDQKVAGEFMLNKLDKSEQNEQLLMLLHGPPGTGKTFLIEQLQKMTNVKMRITATSGVAAMSLQGTTIDHFLGRGRGKGRRKKSKLETVRSNLGSETTLLVLDEVSMLGCAKLLELDTTLQKLKKTSAPFGGLDVIIVGDFAQLPPVKQTSLIEAMASSLLLHTPVTEASLKTTALFSRFRKFELQEFVRCKPNSPIASLLRQFRSCLPGIGSFTVEDIKRIGVLDRKTLTDDSEFGDATFLVSTRKEKDAIISFAGKMWAEENNRPLYWWYKRPVSFKGCSEDADNIAQSMHRRCSGAKGYYIQGCGATLKHNIAPSSGYANGTRGRVVGIVHKEGYVLPKGGAGEVIKIDPPEYVIMQVIKEDGTISLVPCKRQVTELDYRRDGKDKTYRCWSNRISLSFAQTVHEVQGRTLDRVIVVLGRHMGRSVGKITWSLLYVALSRVKNLHHIRFFPCGKLNSLECFKHLTKLKPPSRFVKWTKGYHKQLWDPTFLQRKQLDNEKAIELKLGVLGRDRTLEQKMDTLAGYLKGLGYGKLSTLKRGMLQIKLNKHMVRKRLWEETDENIERPYKRRSFRRLCRVATKQKQPKKRKRSDVILESLSDEKSPLREVCLGKCNQKKQKKNKQEERMKVCIKFKESMHKEHKFGICEVADDGNNLFRAFSHQIYGVEGLHGLIRNKCCRYMELYQERYLAIIETEETDIDFSRYLDRMRTLQTRGTETEIVALSEFYGRPVELYEGQTNPRLVTSALVDYDDDRPPIRLSLNDRNVYYSVVTKDHRKTTRVSDVAGVFEDSALFQHAMKLEHNFEIRKMPDDGNCLFSAFAHQVYGDDSLHAIMREKCCDYMELHSEKFSEFIDTDNHYRDFAHYLDTMRTLRTWGDNLEITALSEIYQRRVEVYAQETTPRITLSDSVNYNNELPPIRVSFKNGNHYNSVVAENHNDTILNSQQVGEFEDAVLASLNSL